MGNRKSLLLLLLVGGLLTACQPAKMQPPEPPGGPVIDGSASLSQWIGGQICDATGGVLLIASPQGRYLDAAGVRGVDDSTPVKPSDRFEIGSNTKSFTVVLALQLQEEGKLSMDDALSEWLPQVTDRLPESAHVTLRQLAGNSSGIPDYADPLMQPLVDSNDQAGLARYWSPEELIDFALEQGPLDFEPGAGWAYSSTNFILLGMVVAKASGQTLDTLYARNIFEPLGMKDSRYHAGVPDRNSLVPGHYQVPGSGLKDMTGWNTSQGGAAGAIISTAEDMERYARGLMGGKLFNRPETLNEMLAMRELDMTTGGLFMSGYALGVFEYRTRGEARLVGHSGQTPGFQSAWAASPGQDIYIVFLTNSGSCPAALLPGSLDLAALGLIASG